ncbi:MAG: DUF1257 domain-containing protein [Anaerolineae bacterium]
MSHFTRVRTQLRSIEMVKKALEDLGYHVHESGMVSGYGQQQTHADLVVSTDSKYDIGFRREGDAVVMVADFWGLHIDRQAFLNQVAQRYAYLTVMEQAQMQGWTAMSEELQADGSIKLVMQRWA